MPFMKIVPSQGWKQLTLKGGILSGGIDGLIGVEELTEYNVENANNTVKVPAHKKQVSSKRKNSSKWIEEDCHAETSLDEPKKHKKLKTIKESTKVEKVEQESKLTNERDDEDKIKENWSSDFNISAWNILGVPNTIIEALADENFISPTPIQALTIPPAIFGRRDILGAAETGSGKTLAFGIPILTGILKLKSSNGNLNDKVDDQIIPFGTNEDNENSDEDEDENQFQNEELGCTRVIDNLKMDRSHPQKPLYALILTPSRELAIQIKNHLVKVAKHTDIKIAVVVGGMAAVKQERILSKGPEIVIATPGRLWELIDLGNAHLAQIDSLKYFVIDETDRMLEKGHFQELHQLLEKINFNEDKIKQRQTFVFSATLTLVHDIPEYLQKKKKILNKSRITKLSPDQKLQKIISLLKMKNPKIVDITKTTGTNSNLTECRIACTIDHKDYYLYYFLKKHPGRTLIFCNSIGCVKRLTTLFGILDCNPLPLHASMIQKQRLKNLERFVKDENSVLIATDVAARGLDIPKVEHVIHYQVPRTSESYVHRSGRTARAQKEGITVLIMEPSEKQNYIKLCKTLGRTKDLPLFPVIDRLLIAVKERVNIARDIDKLGLHCRRDNSKRGWLEKAAEELDLILDEDQIETTMESDETARLQRQLKAKKHELNALLSQPLFPKGFSGKYLDMNVDCSMPGETNKAIEIMKKAIEENPSKKKSLIVSKKKGSSSFKKKKKKN